MDIRLALMAGTDIPIPECQLILHQPRIKDIAMIGEETLFSGIQCLTITKEMVSLQDETLLSDTSNFQIFMTIMTEKEVRERKENTIAVLKLLFPSAKISFTPRSIIFLCEDGPHAIDENNFNFLQDMIRKVFCFNSDVMGQSTFNPKDAAAAEIAKKLQRGRQRVAAQNGEANSSIFVQYTSILTVALPSMSLNDLLNTTMYQLFDLMERYSLYVNWDLDIRSRLAGGTPDSKPENWMKNIH